MILLLEFDIQDKQEVDKISSHNMLRIKQNDGSNNIVRNLNNFRKASLVNYNDKKYNTDKGIILKIDSTDDIEYIENKLKYPNIKKLFIYLCYRMTKDNIDDLKLNINEFLQLKGQQRQAKTVNALIEDLKVLEAIEVLNFTATVEDKKVGSHHSKFLFKPNDKECKRLVSISVKAGNWAQTLKNSNQFAYIPKEVFEFDKLSFDITFNILIRCRNQIYKNMLKNKKTIFSLSVKSILKGVDIPDPRKYGARNVVEKIDGILTRLVDLDLLNYNYRGQSLDKLPKRNILEVYQEYMVDFDIKNKRLERVYKNDTLG